MASAMASTLSHPAIHAQMTDLDHRQAIRATEVIGEMEVIAEMEAIGAIGVSGGTSSVIDREVQI